MPPRKQKQPEPAVQETPVIFFLKVPEEPEEEITPAGDVPSYSEILQTVERSAVTKQFSADLLKPILESLVRDKTYSEHTACFWCCHPFEWTACPLPVSYDAYQNLYTCEGNFCSPECGLAYLYADNRVSDSIRWNRHAMTAYLYASIRPNLSPAPPRSLLRLFGGPLSIEQYREYCMGSNELVMSELPPIRVIFPTMNVQGPLRDVKKYVSLSNDVIEKASESLRLKRSKPVHVNVPTLDMCMAVK